MKILGSINTIIRCNYTSLWKYRQQTWL